MSDAGASAPEAKLREPTPDAPPLRPPTHSAAFATTELLRNSSGYRDWVLAIRSRLPSGVVRYLNTGVPLESWPASYVPLWDHYACSSICASVDSQTVLPGLSPYLDDSLAAPKVWQALRERYSTVSAVDLLPVIQRLFSSDPVPVTPDLFLQFRNSFENDARLLQDSQVTVNALLASHLLARLPSSFDAWRTTFVADQGDSTAMPSATEIFTRLYRDVKARPVDTPVAAVATPQARHGCSRPCPNPSCRKLHWLRECPDTAWAAAYRARRTAEKKASQPVASPTPCTPKALLAIPANVSLLTLHRRLAHLPVAQIKNIVQSGLVTGVDWVYKDQELRDFYCNACLASKAHALPFARSKSIASGRLDLLHVDVAQMPRPTFGGHRYMLVIIDDFSRKHWCILLALKSDVFPRLRDWILEVENATGNKVKTIRSDNGGEFTLRNFVDFCTSKGIRRELTIPYTPQQNGRVKRSNRTIKEGILALLYSSGADSRLWGEAALYYVHCKNLMPHAGIGGEIPDTRWHGFVLRTPLLQSPLDYELIGLPLPPTRSAHRCSISTGYEPNVAAQPTRVIKSSCPVIRTLWYQGEQPLSSMSNPAISTRHATCATREAGRNGSTTSKPNARTDLEHANFQAIALLRRSVSLNIKKQIKDGFDHTPTDVLKMIKKAVAAGTVTDIFIKLQALLDAGPPPSGVDAFEKYQANTIELFNTLSGYNLTFDQVISIRLIHFGKDLYKEYYTQALRQDLDKLPDPIEALQTLQTQAESTPAHKPVAMVASLTATDRSSSTPSALCRHCGGPHWNRKCPVKDKKSKASSAPSASLAAAPDISTLVDGPVRGYLTAAMSTLAKPSLILDSGATHHIVNDRACFTNFRKCKPAPLEGITGEAVNSIEGVGSAVVRSFDGSIGQLHHALFVPSAPVSLFSASRANAAGYDINLSRGKATVSVDGSICHTGEITNGLYHMHASLVDVTTLIEQPVNMEVALNEDLKCDTCQAGKITHHPFPTVASNRSAQPLDRVHMDLLAFDGAVSLGGAKYALVIVDDYTRYLWAIPMSHKSDTFAAFKSWLAKVERSSSRKLLAVRSDNGGEFLSNEFSSFLEEQGITRQLSIPDTPQQNGVAERANRSITEGVRSMLHQSGLSHALWAEALATYVYVKNRSPHSANSGVTPHTRWHGSKPSAGHLRVFGCRAWKAATTEARSKLDPRGIPLVFVGYDLESKGYRLFDPATRQVFKSRSVTFFEDEFPARREGITAAHAPVAGDDDDDDDDDDEVVVLPDQHANQAPPDQAELPAALRFDAPGPAWQPPVGSRPRNPPARYGALASLRSTPSAFAFSLGKEVTELVADLEAAGIDTSKANRPLSEPEDPFSLPSSDPTTWNEAMRHPHAAAWKAGAIEEFRSMKDDLKVFSVVELSSVPKGATILPSRHVFRTKRDKAGKMVSLKNHIVAQGCAQGPNSFNNTFSPTAKYTSIRTLIAHSASKGHHIIQADVDKAYLHSVLEEEIYMRVPTGIEGYEGKCLRLHRSIYGLKQAGRVWNDTINATLASLGYRRLACDECIYRHEDAGGDHYIALYVDDLLFFGPDLGEIDRVLDQLDTLYGVKRLGPAEWVLGVQVVRHDDGGISLLQRQYLLDVLARFNMSDCNPCKSPMEANLQLSPEPDTDSADNAIYRSMIGSLMYAVVATRPDLAHSVGYLSRFVGKAGNTHLEAAKRVLRYIKGSLDLGIHYTRTSAPLLGYEGYSDSDWGSDIQTSRSTMGYLFKLAGGAISWSSRLQPRVACSSTEAEYLGLSHAAKEAVFLRSLLTELGLDTSSPLRLLGDNQGAIALTQNPVFHARTKHLRMLEHFVREHVRNGEISVTYIPTHDMVADIFTKPLPRVVFQRHCDAIGLRRISGQEQGGVCEELLYCNLHLITNSLACHCRQLVQHIAVRFLHFAPDISTLRAFGCRAWHHLPSAKRTDLDPKAVPLLFVGFDQHAKAFRLFEPSTRRIQLSRNVVFRESEFPALRPATDVRAEPIPLPVTVDAYPDQVDPLEPSLVASPRSLAPRAEPPRPVPAAPDQGPHRPAPDQGPHRPAPACEVPDQDSLAPPAPDQGSPARELPDPESPASSASDQGSSDSAISTPCPSPRPVASRALPAPPSPARSDSPDPIDLLPRPRDVASLCQAQEFPDDVDDALHSPSAVAYLASGAAALIETSPADPAELIAPARDPPHWRAAMATPQADEWRLAARDEFGSLLRDFSAFTPIDESLVPADAKVLGSRFVFRTKRDQHGQVKSYKGRLVARGDSQRSGIDFDETFAPVAKFTSIRALLALAAAHGYHVHQADIDKAYLHGKLDAPLYIRVPDGIYMPGKVLQLHRSLYGLRQAGRIWNNEIDSALSALGYVATESDHCVYVRTTGDVHHYIALYVDNLLMISPSLPEIERTLQGLEQRYGVKRLGEAEYVLGIQIRRSPDGSISLSQEQYLKDVLARFGMSDAHPVATPMQPDLRLEVELQPTPFPDRTRYLQAIGSLMYASTGTRPDLAYTVGYLARFSHSPSAAAWGAVKHAFRYLAGTLSHGLRYARGNPAPLLGYSDCNWGACVLSSKSTMGYTFVYAGAAVSWSSRLQSRVADSTCDAEYLALSHAGKEAIFLHQLFGELGLSSSKPVLIYGDNQGANALTKNPVFHARTRHIRLREHFVRDMVSMGDTVVQYINTGEMTADIFTKALSRDLFARHRGRLGICAP
ncbi:BQ5605_C003g02007 [Microbotryum silenes-dioicae]|uniref:BQ5605_C003g02007 protein n=1 Tax=Microbotryum silenes-dioicae TaxID=796604 RepID=A0A2X0MMH1_9BASI|nr:BQ5605_C003g02007 [Microbotryum silenes-dioicae]